MKIELGCGLTKKDLTVFGAEIFDLVIIPSEIILNHNEDPVLKRIWKYEEELSEEKNNITKTLGKTIEEKNNIIKTLGKTIEEKNNIIKTLGKTIEEKNNIIKTLGKTIEEIHR